MSYPADCPACIAGDHNGHDAAHGTRKGLIGGNYCACTGDCAERAAAAFAKAFPVTASDARPPSDGCECPPCPGRGNDGHGLTHCAECCFGTGVEADIDCPVHGDARPPSDTGTTGWHTHGPECVWPDGRCYVCDAEDLYDPPPNNPSARPVFVVDPAEARETIARTLAEHQHGGRVHSGARWVECLCGERLPCEFDGPPHHDPTWDEAAEMSSDYLALIHHQRDRIFAALAGQGQP